MYSIHIPVVMQDLYHQRYVLNTGGRAQVLFLEGTWLNWALHHEGWKRFCGAFAIAHNVSSVPLLGTVFFAVVGVL